MPSGSLMVFYVWFIVVIVAGVALTARSRRYTPARWWISFSSRVSDSVQVVSSRFGSMTVAVLCYFCGFGVMIALLWPLGLLAHALEGSVDKPVFAWFQHRQLGYWSDIWLVLTNIGKPRIAQELATVAACVFAVLWAVRGLRWWVPLVIFTSGYALEKYVQFNLQAVVHRGHPPTTLGTFPSGGCARVVMIYGLVIFCIVYLTGRESRQAWFAGWSLLAVLVSIQAYARTYNLEHWITDVVGGVVFGVLGLIVMTTCLRVLSDPPGMAGESEASLVASRVGPQG